MKSFDALLKREFKYWIQENYRLYIITGNPDFLTESYMYFLKYRNIGGKLKRKQILRWL